MNETGLPLAAELGELAARMSPLLLSVESVAAAVEVLTSLAVEAVAAATGAGVSLMDDQGQRTSQGATSAVVWEADDVQYWLNEGPCLTAWAERRTVRVDHIDEDPRWPRWSESVRPLRLLSSLSTPMVVADRTLGAVKVYSPLRAAFDERTERLLEGFASTAALLLGNVASLDNGRAISQDLRQALKARDTIQLAKGVLIQREGLTQDEAFQALVAEAKVTGREMVEVATRITSTTSHLRPAR